MKNKKLKFNLAIPKTPREFYCEVSNLLLILYERARAPKLSTCFCNNIGLKNIEG